jgi:hypothetical protein
MELHQGADAFEEGLLQGVDGALAEIDVLQQTGPPVRKVDLEADVAPDSLAIMIADLVQPEVTRGNSLQDGLNETVPAAPQEVLIDIEASLAPWQLTTIGRDELKGIRMVVVQVKRDGSILEGAPAAKSLVEGAVDLGKGDWSTGGQAAAVVGSLGTELTEVDGASSPIAEGVGSKPPGGLDAIRTLHGVLHDEHCARHGQPAFLVGRPGLDPAGAGDEPGDRGWAKLWASP